MQHHNITPGISLPKRQQGKDTKLIPYKRICSLKKLIETYYNGYVPGMDFNQYDQDFTATYLRTIDDKKIWKL